MESYSKTLIFIFSLLFIICAIYAGYSAIFQSGKRISGAYLSQAAPEDLQALDCVEKQWFFLTSGTNIPYSIECPENVTQWTEPFITGAEYLKKSVPKSFSGVALQKDWDLQSCPDFWSRKTYLVEWTQRSGNMFFLMQNQKRYVPPLCDDGTLKKIGMCRNRCVNNKAEEMEIAATLVFYYPSIFNMNRYATSQKEHYKNVYVKVYFTNGIVVEGMERDFPHITDNPQSARIILDNMGNLVSFIPVEKGSII